MKVLVAAGDEAGREIARRIAGAGAQAVLSPLQCTARRAARMFGEGAFSLVVADVLIPSRARELIAAACRRSGIPFIVFGQAGQATFFARTLQEAAAVCGRLGVRRLVQWGSPGLSALASGDGNWLYCGLDRARRASSAGARLPAGRLILLEDEEDARSLDRARAACGADVILASAPGWACSVTYATGGALRRPAPVQSPPSHFPLFFDLRAKSVLFVGAGKVAKRRISSILRSGCSVSALDPDESAVASLPPQIAGNAREYREGDCAGFDYVFAASSDSAVNGLVRLECERLGIPVNVASDRRRCDFYFPAVVDAAGARIGIASEANDHALTSAMARAVKDLLEKEAYTIVSKDH